MKMRESCLRWFDHVQIGVINERVGKINLIQVERERQRNANIKMSKSNKKEWHVNQGNNKEFDFRYNRIEKKNTCG